MKRSILILTTFVSVLVAAAAAQSATCQLGVKGGVSVMELTNDGESSGDRTSFAGGAYLLADFSKQFGLRVEGLYIQKGAHEDEGADEATIKLDYIEFPILAVAHVPLGEKARLDFFGGPTLGFNVKSELEITLGSKTGVLAIDESELASISTRGPWFSGSTAGMAWGLPTWPATGMAGKTEVSPSWPPSASRSARSSAFRGRRRARAAGSFSAKDRLQPHPIHGVVWFVPKRRRPRLFSGATGQPVISPLRSTGHFLHSLRGLSPALSGPHKQVLK